MLCLSGIVFAAAVSGIASGYFWFLRPVGNGPAGPQVTPVGFKEVWSSRPVLLLGVGDSITAGFGPRPGRSYFDRLVANPPDEFEDMQGRCLSRVLPNLRATNVAMSGSIPLQHLDKQIEPLPRHPPEVFGLVVLTTGGNDIIHNYGWAAPREGAMYGATFEQAQPWIASFEQRLNTMTDRLGALFPAGCEIFLANIYDPTDGLGDAHRAGLPRWKDGLAVLRAYNEVIARCASERANVHLVNLHEAFLGHGIHCRQFWRRTFRSEDPFYWYNENLEDPDERGYDAIRRLFLLEMVRVLPARLAGAPISKP